MTAATSPQATSKSARAAPPRVALVGCGTVGNLHLDRLLAEKAEIVAVCDPDSDALAQVAARLPQRPRLFRSEQDLLQANLAEAVVLCTPHDRHVSQVRAALDARVHVLCEKPFALDVLVAQELVAQARTQNIGLFVSYGLRSQGHALFLLAASGRIGPLQHVAVTWSQPWLQRFAGTWRLRSRETGGGFVHDTGALVLDLLLRLVDSPVSDVEALLQLCGQEVDVRASLRLGFKNGVRADVTLIGDGQDASERIQLWGEQGTASWWMHEGARPELYLRPTDGPAAHGDPGVHGISPDAAFVAALRSGRSFGLDTAPDLYAASSALPVIALLERIHAHAVWK